MSIRYVNPVRGQDTPDAQGTSDKPFKTISYALSQTSIVRDGDEINVADVSSVLTDTYIETKPVVIENRNDITIRFGDSGDSYSQLIWLMEPATEEDRDAITSHPYALFLKKCRGIKIIGANFGCLSTSGQLGCIHAEDCQGLEIYHTHVDRDFKVTSPNTSLFLLDRCVVEINDLTANKIKNGLINDGLDYGFRFIDLRGDTSATLYSVQYQDYLSSHIPFTALHADSDVRNVYINGFLIHDCESRTVPGSYGIVFDCDQASITDFDIRNCQFSHLRHGFVVNGLSVINFTATRRICNSTFYHCCKAIEVSNSDIAVVCVSIYGTDDTGTITTTREETTINEDGEEEVETIVEGPYNYQYFCEHELGIKKELDTIGVSASDAARIEVMNTIVTNCDTAFKSAGSYIDVTRTIFSDCSYYKSETNNGIVTARDYVRATDPKYLEIDRYDYGFFYLKNSSPCINAGKDFGLSYDGVAPNIGAIDFDVSATVNDIPVILSRELRNSESLIMTNMDVENLIVQGIKDLDPDANAEREGSALRDLVVKPISQLTQVILSEIDNIRQNQSFQNIDNMNDDAVDALAANLLVERKGGTKAGGAVRIYFDKPMDIDLPAEMLFTSASGLRFYSLNNTVVSREEMAANSDNGLYFIDILVEAEEPGTEYEIGPNEITGFDDIVSDHIVLVTNVGYFSGGSRRENNMELYERTKLAVTTRCLNTTRGIKFQFLDKFNYLRRVTVIGKGDSEMIRDDLGTLLNGTDEIIPVNYGVTDLSKIHVGGMTDVYVQVYEPIEDYAIAEAPGTLVSLGSIGLTDKPVLRITSIEICDPTTQDSLGVYLAQNDWELVSNDPRTRFSVREDVSLRISNDYAASTLKINYVWASEIAALQQWAEADDNRVVCEDILVKHHQPAFVSMSVAYYADEEQEDMQYLISEFIKSVPEKKSLKVSDIVSYMYEQRAIHVITPLLITAVVHKVDGSIERIESFDEVIIDRTACFIPDEIEVVYLGEDQFS